MSSYRILIIEDDSAIGQSLVDGFKRHGFEPDLCTTGRAGLEFVKKYSPHLILLDIRLPDGSGFDVCRQMNRPSS
jgi:DNA-binding response OmpR family regulator